MTRQLIAMMFLILSINLVLAGDILGDESNSAQPLIGYTELQTNLYPSRSESRKGYRRIRLQHSDALGELRILHRCVKRMGDRSGFELGKS